MVHSTRLLDSMISHLNDKVTLFQDPVQNSTQPDLSDLTVEAIKTDLKVLMSITGNTTITEVLDFIEVSDSELAYDLSTLVGE